MSIRQIRNHGKRVWQARVAVKGAGRKSTIRTSRDAARMAEATLLQELRAEAEKVKREGDQPATLRDLLDRYAEGMRKRGRGEASVARVGYTSTAIEGVLPGLLEEPVGALGDGEVLGFRNARHRAGIKPSTINRDLRTLRAALKAVRPDYRFPGEAFFKEDETRVRWLRPEEELLVLETMASPFREIAKLAALTLMRLTEVRTLKRGYVHLEQGVVMLPTAKAGARAVMLSTAAQGILRKQLKDLEGEWVFPNRDGGPYSREQIGRVFRRAARAAGLEDFHFHDLRHHGATMALNRGFTAPIVMALGGWKTERMMRRYAAVTDTTLRAAAEAVSGSEQWQPMANLTPQKVSP